MSTVLCDFSFLTCLLGVRKSLRRSCSIFPGRLSTLSLVLCPTRHFPFEHPLLLAQSRLCVCLSCLVQMFATGSSWIFCLAIYMASHIFSLCGTTMSILGLLGALYITEMYYNLLNIGIVCGCLFFFFAWNPSSSLYMYMEQSWLVRGLRLGLLYVFFGPCLLFCLNGIFFCVQELCYFSIFGLVLLCLVLTGIIL